MLESYLNEKQLLFRVRIAIVRVRNWKCSSERDERTLR